MIGHVEGDGTIVMTGDLGASVLGANIIPCQGAITLCEGLLEEINEGWIGGEDLTIIDVHDNGAFLGGIIGIVTVVDGHV